MNLANATNEWLIDYLLDNLMYRDEEENCLRIATELRKRRIEKKLNYENRK